MRLNSSDLVWAFRLVFQASLLNFPFWSVLLCFVELLVKLSFFGHFCRFQSFAIFVGWRSSGWNPNSRRVSTRSKLVIPSFQPAALTTNHTFLSTYFPGFSILKTHISKLLWPLSVSLPPSKRQFLFLISGLMVLFMVSQVWYFMISINDVSVPFTSRNAKKRLKYCQKFTFLLLHIFEENVTCNSRSPRPLVECQECKAPTPSSVAIQQSQKYLMQRRKNSVLTQNFR